MSEFWELFEETGDIGYYLLYLGSNEENTACEKQEADDTDQTSS